MNEHFQCWLRRRYTSIAALNGAWRTHHGSFEQVVPRWPPQARRRDDLPPILDWLVFCDEAEADEDRPQDDLFGQFVPRQTLLGSARAPYPVIYDHGRMLARQRLADGGRRMVQGVVNRAIERRDAEDSDIRSFAIRTALMHGATCGADETATWAAPECRLAGLLAEAGVQPDRKLLMLYPRLYAHLRMIMAGIGDNPAAESGASAAVADVAALDFGFQREPHSEGPALYRKLLDLTDRCGFPWEAADSRLPLEKLQDYALVVCPTLEILDHAAMQRLDDFVSLCRGYAAIGPRVPMLNEQLRGERTLARHFPNGLSEFGLEIYRVGDGAFFTLPGYMSAATIEFLCFESGLARGLTATQPQPSTMQPDLTVVDEDVDVVVHRNGRRRIVFVANPTSLQRTVDLTREPVRRLVPLDFGADGVTALPAIGPMRVVVPPRKIAVFEAG